MRKRFDRLTPAEYSIDDGNEAFTTNDLGNRDSVNVRDGNNVNYDIANLTNRYDNVGDANITHAAAGNLTTDKDGYQYEYDCYVLESKFAPDPAVQRSSLWLLQGRIA